MTGFSDEVRELIRQRATDCGVVRCEVMQRCTGRSVALYDLHHRRCRAMGGSSRPETNQAANGLAVCRDCHSFIEVQRAYARRHGWLVRQGKDPATIPVLRRGNWVWLNNIGGCCPAAVPCVCGLYESEHLSPNSPCGSYAPDAETA